MLLVVELAHSDQVSAELLDLVLEMELELDLVLETELELAQLFQSSRL